MEKTNFKALVIEEGPDRTFIRRVSERPIAGLPAGELLVRVLYSSLNYKDALSASGNRGVTRRYPHTPGIDAAGIVEQSLTDDFKPGDEVLVTGHDLGMNTSGGFGQYIRVPADWTIGRPAGLTLRDSMIYGTAGFTAALSVAALLRHGLSPEQGRILVTGASGGVGSIAVAILARLGFSVSAASGKPTAADFLHRLGAAEIIPRLNRGPAQKALLQETWAGVIDTVGGDILAAAIKATKYGGVVTCCGNVASPELALTVYPFILRGISLVGIDSVNCPGEERLGIWQKLAGPWRPDKLESLGTEIGLLELDRYIDLILAGKLQGRTVIRLD